MFSKKCPYCSKKSFSASIKGRWDCPYCGRDLSGLDAQVADNGDHKNVTSNVGKTRKEGDNR